MVMNRIHLGAIVEREGRILLIRQTPRSDWELPGGVLQPRQDDADQAMKEALETFGIFITEPEERFLETIYLPDEQGQIIYNVYSAGDWTGDPEIPIGMGAGWFAFDELAAISMQDEVRQSVLVAYGLAEAPDHDARILQAMSGSVSDPAAHQPTLGTAQPAWARPADTPDRVSLPGEPGDIVVDPSDVPDIEADEVAVDESEEIVESLREEPMESTPAAEAVAEPEVELSIGAGQAPESEPGFGAQGTESPGAPQFQSRRERGMNVMSTLGGGTDPIAAFDRIVAQYPELGADVVDFALGEVWARDGLNRRERSLLVVAMLTALGGRPGPLASHLNGALNHGATPDELVEVMRMVAVYAGFPAALEGWKLMEATFETKGVKPSGREP